MVRSSSCIYLHLVLSTSAFTQSYITLGGVAVRQGACWTCDQEVMGQTLGRGAAAQQLWATCSHFCAPVTKQYNLVQLSMGSDAELLRT